MNPNGGSGWKDTHCISTPNDTTSHLTVALVPYFGAPTVVDWQNEARRELRAADRALSQSHPNVKEHFRFACEEDSSGNWRRLWVRAVSIPVTADTDANGTIGCDEVDFYLGSTPPYNKPDRRYIRFLDPTVDREGQWCSYGWSGPQFTGDNDEPGLDNLNNSAFGFANIDSVVWSSAGVSNYSVTNVLHEWAHSLGQAVCHTSAAPGAVCAGSAAYHTNDYPDLLWVPYSGPPNGQKHCTGVPTTFPDTYWDCGRNTYWAPRSGTANWLCTHYNMAWDSKYLRGKPARPSGCPG